MGSGCFWVLHVSLKSHEDVRMRCEVSCLEVYCLYKNIELPGS